VVRESATLEGQVVGAMEVVVVEAVEVEVELGASS
jgi:hypothetical protein